MRLAGYFLVTTSKCVGKKMSVPEDSHAAVPLPSKAEPWWEAGAGSSSLWAQMTGPSV